MELQEEFGGLAFNGGQAKMAIEHVLGIFEDGFEGIGVGGGSDLDLIAEFEPSEMDEGESDGAFELARGVEDEAAIGGGEDSGHGIADALGKVAPTVVGGNPVGHVWDGRDGDIGRRRCFATARSFGFSFFDVSFFVLLRHGVEV